MAGLPGPRPSSRLRTPAAAVGAWPDLGGNARTTPGPLSETNTRRTMAHVAGRWLYPPAAVLASGASWPRGGAAPAAAGGNRGGTQRLVRGERTAGAALNVRGRCRPGLAAGRRGVP